MFNKKTIRDVDVRGQVVLMRVDYNVPLKQLEDGSYAVANDLRIKASLPTIEYLRERGAKKIILISHLGRPKGKDESLSLTPVAQRLAELLPDVPVKFVNDVAGAEVNEAVEDLPDGGVLLLENLRFWPEEKANDVDFAQGIVDSTGATLFVQDGFGATHRAHASTSAITKVLPAVEGLLVEKEVQALTKVLENPERPFVVIIGGAKIEDKQPMIDQFLPKADKLLVGGKIAADGYENSDEKVLVAEDFDEDEEGNKLDIGPLSAGKFVEELKNAKTVLWSGVLGKVEDQAFATSSEIVAKFLGEHPEIVSVVCGGDTAGYVENLREKNPELKFSLVSTGGGAALELLTGGEMSGIAALEDK